MPATSKQIDAILKDKGVKFHSLYANESQRWFVDFVLDAELKNGATVVAATATCKKLIADILALLATLSTWALKDPIQTEKPKHLDVWSDRLVEIVYGVAAEAPAILSQSNYLGFIVRRRLRTVVRMQGYVNDLGGAWRRGYVTYQGDCRLGTTRVCEEATTLWAPVTPFTVAAGQTAVDALTALFAQSHPDPATSKCAFNPVTNTGHIELCKSNKFDCAHAVNAVSLDALLEAADPAVFLPTVQASSTRADYFSIRYPPRPAPPPEHVFWRPTAASKALFRRTAIPAPQISPVTGGTTPAASRVDLQTGDHIYIRNLPLFQAVAPDDVWQGEHSIVVKVGNRSFNNAKGFLFSGHGIAEFSLVQAMQGFNDRLNTALSRAARLGGLFLDTVRTPAVLPPEVTSVTPELVQVPARLPPYPLVSARLFKLTLGPVSFDSYDDIGAATPTPSKMAYGSANIFVVERLTPEHEFALIYIDDRQAVLDRGFAQGGCVLFRRTAAPAPGQSSYERLLWTIPYEDVDGNETFFPIFERAGKPRLLELKDMPVLPFKRLNPAGSEVLILRPLVDLTPSYLTALAADGAI